MNRPRNCAAVIPCWNEAETVADLVQAVRVQLPGAIVIDDGSTDDTATRAQAAGACVVRHHSNRGKGAALRSGLNEARQQGLTWAVTMDGDGQHSPVEIPAFLACAEATGADLVIGDRLTRGESMPWPRGAVNRWMSRRLSRRAGVQFPDSQCGFRLLRLDAWAGLALNTDHFEVESEVLLGFIAAGFRVGFVPIPVIPSRRPSRIRVLPDTARWLRWWWQSPRRAEPAARRSALSPAR